MLDTLASRYKAVRGRLIVLPEPRPKTALLVPESTLDRIDAFSPRPVARLATVVCAVGELNAGDRVWVKPDPQMVRDEPEGEVWLYGAGENWQDAVYAVVE